MYLEISARQTGKTERLCEAAAQAYFNEMNMPSDKNIMLIGHNHSHAKEMDFKVRDLIARKTILQDREAVNKMLKYRLHYTTDFRSYLNNTSAVRGTMYMEEENWKLFYDEFDFIETKPGCPIVIRDDGYYCSKAKKTRVLEDLVQHAMGKPDVLLDLLRANGGKHVTYAVTNFLENMTLKDIRQMGRQLPTDCADMEFGNQYIKTW